MTDNEPQAAFTFPDSALTDTDRLTTLWRLQQQMIDQHNTTCAALADRSAVLAFQKDWAKRLLTLHSEINRLKAAVYPVVPQDGEDNPAVVAKFAARVDTRWDAELTDHPVLLSRPLPSMEVDPLEDFTTYTEVDPNSHVAITDANTITFDSWKNEDTYVYRDCGAGHFTDYTHEWAAEIGSSSSGAPRGITWAMCVAPISSPKSNGDAVMLDTKYSWSGHWIHYLWHRKSDVQQDLDYTAETTDATPYFRATRTGSTVSVLIYTDAARTVLWDTLTIDDDGTARQFFVPAASWNDGYAQWISLVTRNTDLQETARLALLAGPLAGLGQAGFGLLR